MSGIYIPGMEMPEDSDMIVIYSDGTTRKYLSYTKVIIDEAKAVTVPPHGRLIDADCCNDYFYEHMSDDMMIAAMNAINEMPTIIPADKEEYKCESCVYNPPSSCDGKPCTQCDTRNPLTNCYIPADKGGKK